MDQLSSASKQSKQTKTTNLHGDEVSILRWEQRCSLEALRGTKLLVNQSIHYKIPRVNQSTTHLFWWPINWSDKQANMDAFKYMMISVYLKRGSHRCSLERGESPCWLINQSTRSSFRCTFLCLSMKNYSHKKYSPHTTFHHSLLVADFVCDLKILILFFYVVDRLLVVKDFFPCSFRTVNTLKAHGRILGVSKKGRNLKI